MSEQVTSHSWSSCEHERLQSLIENVAVESGRLRADVLVETISGHKLPTAYPSRRAWLHFIVRDRDGRVVFESGALSADGSIAGNDNDADPAPVSSRTMTKSAAPTRSRSTNRILGDEQCRVTTGLLAAYSYLKDNRLLPDGFDKQTAESDIAVIGDAFKDPTFTGRRSPRSLFRAARRGNRTIHDGSRTLVSAHRLPLGQQPEVATTGPTNRAASTPTSIPCNPVLPP